MNFRKLFVSVLVAAAVCGGAFALNANVVSVTGKVEIKNGNSWLALKKGDKVEKGDVISTGFNSQAVLEVKGTTFTLSALTRMTVEDLVEEQTKDSTKLFLDSGSVSADVKGANGKRAGFKVRSPIATASVRGTSFTFSAAGKLSVSEGLVSFSHSEGPKAQVESNSGASDDSSSESSETPKSTVFTSANEVGGTSGVPVAQGQQSAMDSSTGLCTTPAFEKRSALSAANSTETLSSLEAVTTCASSSGYSGAMDSGDINMVTAGGATTATLEITLEF